MNDSPSFLHHTNFLLTPGGMQRVIQLHLHTGAGRHRAVAFRDQVNPSHPGQTADLLAIPPSRSIRALRLSYNRAVHNRIFDVAVFHNGWGLELVHDLVPAPFRVSFLHSDFPRFPSFLRRQASLSDIVVNINPALHELSVAVLPGYPRERFLLLDYPIAWPARLPELRERSRDAFRIGIAGRIKRAQKRLDRLPAFLDLCDRLSWNIEFEILGTGDYEKRLRQRLAGRSNVRFLGWREGPQYWDTLARWRYILFLSDYEGTPLTLLEAAGAGTIPLYPDFHPGRTPPPGVLHEQLYPTGDICAAARVLADLEGRQAEFRGHWLEATKGLVRRHSEEAYLRSFAEQLDPARLAELPPKPEVEAPRRLPDWLPLEVYNWRVKRERFGRRGVLWHR